LLLLGCGSDAKQAVTITNAGCTLPKTGNYLIHYAPHAGNTCGPKSDEVAAGADIQKGGVDLCPGGHGTITDTPTADGGCEVLIDIKQCQDPGSADREDLLAEATWTADYTLSSGVATFTVTGSMPCQGTYDFTFTRQ
jgi:hypothetical protein